MSFYTRPLTPQTLLQNWECQKENCCLFVGIIWIHFHRFGKEQAALALECFSVHPSVSVLVLPKMRSILTKIEMIGNSFIVVVHWREHWFYSCLLGLEQVFALACTEGLLTSYVLWTCKMLNKPPCILFCANINPPTYSFAAHTSQAQ